MERTALPATKARDNLEDERSVLLGYLTYHRIVLARKLEGLSDDDARRADVRRARSTCSGWFVT